MHQWTAIAAPGLEPIVARELASLGMEVTVEPGAVTLTADLEVGAALSVQARTPTRLLLTIAEGRAASYDQLMALIRKTDWSPWLYKDSPVEVSVSFRDSAIRHKQALERKVGRALRDVRRGLKPNRRMQCGQRLQVRVDNDVARLSLDAGGERLHRRGWRQATGRAPLRENLAASLLFAAGWTGDEPLVDPFCGVGTIPIEAALLAAGRSPHLDRDFAWRGWSGMGSPPDLPQAPETPTRPDMVLIGSDREAMAIESCQANASRAHVALDWHETDVSDLQPPATSGLVIANPPYGRRLGNQVTGVYKTFGHVLRSRFSGWRVLFLAPHADLARCVHRRCERLTTFRNGGTRVGVYVFEC